MTRFSLPPLNYDYKALMPHIDEKTMETHHTKHHAAYINNLNIKIANFENLKNKSLIEIIKIVNNKNDPKYESYKSIRDFAGGHYNHSLFWLNMGPNSTISNFMKQAIEKFFGSMDLFKEQFKPLALSVFGSGWVFLVLENNHLSLKTTQNQDTPMSESCFPIMAFDVWEHAYYLKYMNNRADYIDAFFEVIDWSNVENFFSMAIKGEQVPINDGGKLISEY